jgi:hypothetical protein
VYWSRFFRIPCQNEEMERQRERKRGEDMVGARAQTPRKMTASRVKRDLVTALLV